jgi:hypothetical protein
MIVNTLKWLVDLILRSDEGIMILLDVVGEIPCAFDSNREANGSRSLRCFWSRGKSLTNLVSIFRPLLTCV